MILNLYKKLSFPDPVYVINEEKGLVICKYKCTIKGSYDVNGSNYQMQEIRSVGKARCCGKDKFNIERGKKIAESKARIKAYNKFNKLINQQKKLVEKMLKHYMSLQDKYTFYQTKEECFLAVYSYDDCSW